jgi:hypothetical protein
VSAAVDRGPWIATPASFFSKARKARAMASEEVEDVLTAGPDSRSDVLMISCGVNMGISLPVQRLRVLVNRGGK